MIEKGLVAPDRRQRINERDQTKRKCNNAQHLWLSLSEELKPMRFSNLGVKSHVSQIATFSMARSGDDPLCNGPTNQITMQLWPT